ncbi:hypothetical protein Barb7_01121 [Bacteroidales bacterium Barb7]|nr:hypothetical protein Barb7_01121 [Bacteroidales bacterium Barb7]
MSFKDFFFIAFIPITIIIIGNVMRFKGYSFVETMSVCIIIGVILVLLAGIITYSVSEFREDIK